MDQDSCDLTIGVVILNYATYHQTITLVEALQTQSVAQNLRIVIVDNDSPNESYERLEPLQKRFENVVAVLQTGENLGYAKGNNFGLKYLEKIDTPDYFEKIDTPNYVAILNNDVILPDDCFERLIDKYEILDSPGVIAPMMTDVEGNRLVPYKINNYWDDIRALLFILRLIPNRNKQKEIDNTGHRAMSVEVIPGSFMFVDFKVFKRMGYFYPNTFLYAEERFIYHKAKERGLSNYLILDQTYIHAHKSPTISSFHTQVSKYRMLYKEWIEYTVVCRKHGKLGSYILKPLIWWSLLEWRAIGLIRSFLNK